MALAVIVDVLGGNEQLYNQLKLFPEGKLPERLVCFGNEIPLTRK